MANSDDKSLPDQALEALLYAPIGIAYEVLDRLPTWVARGKSQATITKVLGKMAVQKGQSEFEGVVSDIFGVKLGDEPETAPKGAAPKPKTAAKTATNKTAKVSKSAKKPAAKKTASVEKTASGKKTASGEKSANKTSAKKAASAKKPSSTKKSSTEKSVDAPKKSKASKPTKSSKTAKAPKTSKVPAEADLALASYGSMPASQIVKRLDSLSADQLDAIRSYEEANRHRVTVLNRIRQIQRST